MNKMQSVIIFIGRITWVFQGRQADTAAPTLQIAYLFKITFKVNLLCDKGTNGVNYNMIRFGGLEMQLNGENTTSHPFIYYK